MKRDTEVMEELYKIWCVAEAKANSIYQEVGEDFTHPHFTKAEQHSRNALLTFLMQRTASLRHILLKLEVACKAEDYLNDAMNPACKDIAPKAVISAVRDLEDLITLARPK